MNAENNIPRLVVAGTQSGCGKTTVAIGLMAFFIEDGHTVQPFKAGREILDAELLTRLCKRETRRLDASTVSADTLVENFLDAVEGADIAIVDGWRGFFDGVSGLDFTSSTAHISKLIQSPVIFVIDVSPLYGSAAAVMLGFKNFDRDIRIAGVVLNRAQNEEHYKEVKKAVEFYSGIEVLGGIPNDHHLSMNLSEKNTDEINFKQFAEKAKTAVAAHLDMEKITNLAMRTPALAQRMKNISSPV